MHTGKTRLIVSLPDEDIETIVNIAQKTGLTKTDVIRRAIALEKAYVEKTCAGCRFIIEEPDNTQKVIAFM